MNRRLLVVALVLAAIAVLAVSSASAAAREGYAVVGLADAEQLFPASAAEAKPYDELMDPEFGCDGGGHLEYDMNDD
jgi:hypothetical protein